MGSIPTLSQSEDRLVQIPGSMPRLTEIPAGCAFNPRCGKAFDACHNIQPETQDVSGRQVACLLYDEELKHG